MTAPLRRLEVAVLLAAFAASRLLYHLAGVRFDTGPLAFYWQFLDPELLRADLLRNVAWLHSQPPLFNLFLGAVLHLPEPWWDETFQAVYLLLGLLLGLSLLALQARLGIPPRLRLPLTLLFLLSPACVLYENHLFYTYPVSAALTAAPLFLHRFLSAGRLLDGILSFSLCAAAVLTHSLFHLGWLVFLAFLLASLTPRVPETTVAGRRGCARTERNCLSPEAARPEGEFEHRPQRTPTGRRLSPPSPRRRVLLAAALPLLLCTAWYARSYLLFNTFSASSWLGNSLAGLTTRLLTPAERDRLFAGDPAAPLLRIPPFSPLADYEGIVPLPPPTGLPVLDRPLKSTGAPNFHHLAYLRIAREYQGAALRALRRDPRPYLKGAAAAWLVFLRSAADSNWLGTNLEKIAPFARACDRWLYGQWQPFRGDLGPRHVAWAFALLLPLLLADAGRRVVRAFRQERWEAADLTLLVLATTLLAVMLIGNSLELGENNRFRFMLEPSLMVLLGLFLRDLGRRRGAPR